MTILVDEDTRLLVQGITGREGANHALEMKRYGTRVIAGVTPGKGGTTLEGIPVYDSVREAVRSHPEINASVIFVPARFAVDATYEAIDSEINLIVIITEHLPVHDVIKLLGYSRTRQVKIIGPNCPGIISPGKCKVGIMPGHIFAPGRIGVVSRSGTLTYEIAWALTRANLGQSTAVGIGGDPVTGMDFGDVVELLENDSDTNGIVVIGEIGGDAEERLAKHVSSHRIRKPVVAFVAGMTAPPGKRMGHAGAIITMGAGTAEAKKLAFAQAGVAVANLPSEVPALLARQF